ncbi:hypothetical protein GLAREA_00279 [Glarea lozoyensis ATCC 20868]|uniref:Uncharacterized protein n=1 Tax=Glarea lozoyensis (strain ATCC 20868 / MF5171) TaxID=1116229 RepID=S3DAW1_GLAL2|nr:uncharacterized protein GLAREA_00279 [Glarea lozoyensis ATCC 20868]EPE29121.1 hypothetical protein GLAREA_00279 [Glarea lozoyensis ATCC 20868]
MSFYGDNYSLYAVPAAWFVAFVPHVYSTTFTSRYDKTSPRTHLQEMEKDQTIDQATKDKLTRVNGAKQNGFENIGFFAAAVVAGNVAGLSATSLNGLSAGYVLSRILYTLIYINNTNPKFSDLRSVMWLVGIGQVVTLYAKAGNMLRAGSV